MEENPALISPNRSITCPPLQTGLKYTEKHSMAKKFKSCTGGRTNEKMSQMKRYRPVLARFIPLEVKGDTLPYG